ncbi:MAG: hypothetical protein GY943_09930 [Chloroflexi bacterium]|nr:hypothetical protein [Chloroflexota bacterium]
MKVHTYDYDVHYQPAMPVVEITVRNSHDASLETTLTALVDSGSDATLIPKEILQSVQAIYQDRLNMRGVTGDVQIVDIYNVTIRIGSHIIPNVHVISGKADAEPLIGRDVLNQIIVTLNGLAQVTEISE